MTITYPLDTPLSLNPIIAVTVLGVVATITTVLRFWALKLRQVKPGPPEYFILPALAIVYVDIVIEYILTIYGGAGRDADKIDPSSVVITLKTILPLEALYGIVLSLVKTSILLFYMRIFGTKQSFRTGVFVTMAIVWMWAASVVLETFLLCRPLAYNWDTTINGTCGQRNATYVVAGTLNLITDLMVMGLALPHIWKLHLNMRKKLALSSIFSVGLLVSVISIIRLKSLMGIDFTNITKSVQMGVMWTVIEPELAIICANMPLLKAVLTRIMPSLLGSSRQKYGASDTQTFERIQEQPSANIYPMNRLDHEAIHTYISTNSNESQRELTKQEETSVTSKNRGRVSHSGQSSVPAINVTQNFSVQYL